VLARQQLVGNLRGGHPGPLGHRGAPFVDLVEQTDDSGAAVAELTSDRVASYTTLRDST